MTSQELLGLLTYHWTTVVTELDADDLADLTATLREMREAAADPAAVARAMRRLKRTLSALPPGHPVSEALGGHRYAGAPGELPGPAAVDAVLDVLGAPPPDPGELLRRARERILAVPALSEEEHTALRGGQGPPPAGLIRLRDPERGVRYPRFQFAAGTAEPLPVVLRINGLLRADLDPWGAADWWLGANRWLGGAPAALLGVLPEGELERAAAELVGAP
ncbi:hypothetical protein [Streptomyces sp. NPDC050560]|uniref:hypothetical protein n=1 Tax=Streptomyces sp. NPDC050560 TaxID=3365630 RepID=UPI0037968076